MKHARNALVIILLFATPLLLAGVYTPIQLEARASSEQSSIKLNALSYDTHDPIWILNDTAFHDMASVESWAGTGEPATPYIIEGYNITSDITGILIQHVTVCFEIRGCYIADITPWTSFGINIINASQVSIVDTVIESKSVGMELWEIDSLSITGCTITDIDEESLFILWSEGATVDGCTISDGNVNAIALHEANSTTITNCHISSISSYAGIQVYQSHFVTISNNEISECEGSGIYAINSPHLTIEENTIYENWFYTGTMCGVHLYGSHYSTIVGNEIYDNARNGIFVENTDWAYIFDNHIYNNSDHGIDGLNSDNGTILQNDIHNNGWWPQMINAICGVYLGNVQDWIISDNTIWNNTPTGVTVEVSERVEISNNVIFNNTDTGILCWGAEGLEDITISKNVIHGNGFSNVTPWRCAGILSYGYEHVLVENNLLYNNSNYGISINADNNFIIGNEVYDTGGYGIGIGTEECYNNLVSENFVHHNIYGIFVVNIRSNITDNIVFDNEYGIYMDVSGNCSIYGNDIGWNTINAYEQGTFSGMYILWHDNVSIGNWWHNYNYTGYYNITTDIGIDNQDLFPSRSLDLERPGPIEYEILETDNVIVWEAYALNPSHYEVFVDGSSVLVEDWDGNDIEYLVDGLSHGIHTIELTVYHISGHSIGNSTTAEVEDLTPPEVEGPILIEIILGDDVNVRYIAIDPSGIDSYFVNDTVHFTMSSTGVLTNIVDLELGNYTLLLEIADPYGNAFHMFVTVVVSAPTNGLPTTLILAIGAGGVIVLLVVVAIGYKTKRG